MNHYGEAVKTLGNFNDSPNLDDATLEAALMHIDVARVDIDSPQLDAAFDAVSEAWLQHAERSYWRQQYVHLARAALYAHPIQQAGVQHAN